MTARERASLSEVEYAARSIIADLLLVTMSVEVILAGCKEARRYDDQEAALDATLRGPLSPRCDATYPPSMEDSDLGGTW